MLENSAIIAGNIPLCIVLQLFLYSRATALPLTPNTDSGLLAKRQRLGEQGDLKFLVIVVVGGFLLAIGFILYRGIRRNNAMILVANDPVSLNADKKIHLTAEELEKYHVCTLAKAINNIIVPPQTNKPEPPEQDHSVKRGADKAAKVENSDYECTFCLEKITITDTVRVIPCVHFFHGNCLDSWLLKFSINCPTCRYDLLDNKPSETGDRPVEGDT